MTQIFSEYCDVFISGEVERDQLGDLQVPDISIKIAYDGRVLKLKPAGPVDQAHLTENLISQYEKEHVDDSDHGESFREYK